MKDNRSECMSVDGPVRIQDYLAKTFYDLAPGTGPRPHYVPGELIGIDDDCAALLEHPRHRALSRRDTSCEPNDNHAMEDSMGPLKSRCAHGATD
jgi:hypothetical protein